MGFDDNGDLDTVSVRVAKVVWRMRDGWTPTTKEVGVFCNLDRVSAYLLMARISRVIPIALDERDQRLNSEKSRWRIADGVSTVLTNACHSETQED